MAISVDVAQATDNIVRAVRAGIPIMLKGSPACGKSSIIKAIADDYGLKLIDYRLSMADPTDFMGFPMVDKEAQRSSFAPMETFPLEGDEIPDGYQGWMLFLDELNGGDRGTMKAAYKLLLDREVGMKKLHEKVVLVAAGNLDTDNALVEDMGTALQSRLLHCQLEVNADRWLEWGIDEGIDHRILSYIRFRPENLYKFDPNHEDETFASPRTWHFLSKLLKDIPVLTLEYISLVAGTIGEGVAREFTEFTKIYKDLPDIQQLLNKPETVPVPSEPAILYAMTGIIGNKATETNISQLMKFINRIPKEFQVVCLRDVIRRNKEMMQTDSVKTWVSVNASELF